MSDDDYDDYDEDYFDSDDDYREDLADHVDSLAEHTQHSPVIINANPDFDVEFDEWEYLTDEYWDEEIRIATKPSAPDEKDPKAPEKRKRNAQEAPDSQDHHKRMRQSLKTDEVLQRPLVLWRRKSTEDGLNVPIFKYGDGKKITILRNWRDLLVEPTGLPPGSFVVGSGQDESREPSKASRAAHPTKIIPARQSKRRHEGETDDEADVDLPEKSSYGVSVPKPTRTSKRLKK